MKKVRRWEQLFQGRGNVNRNKKRSRKTELQRTLKLRTKRFEFDNMEMGSQWWISEVQGRHRC